MHKSRVLGSVRRIGEIQALISDPPYMVFQRDRLTLNFQQKLWVRSISEFQMNQSIHLLFSSLTFILPQVKFLTLNTTKALFCLDRRSFMNIPRVTYTIILHCHRLSKRVSGCIKTHYDLTTQGAPPILELIPLGLCGEYFHP